MNVDNNKRFKDTEDKILSAYGLLAANKELAKITVSDVCKEANIHRTTFYGHFDDIFAVQRRIEQRQVQRWAEGFFQNDGKWNLYEGVHSLLLFYYNIQDIMRFHMHSDKTSPLKDELNLFPLVYDVKERYMKAFNLRTENEYESHSVFFTTGFFSVIRHWVDTGCKETPEEMADILCRLLKGMAMAEER